MASMLPCPIEKGFFGPLQVNRKDRRRLSELGDSMFTEALLLSSDQGPIRWKFKETRDQVTVYQGGLRQSPQASHLASVDGNDLTGNGYVRAIGKIRTTISEAINFLTTHSTDEYRAVLRKIFPAFVDSYHVGTVREVGDTSSTHSHLATKWLTVRHKAPLSVFLHVQEICPMMDRDFCLLEYSDIKVSRSGKQVGFYLLESIERSEVPDLSAPYKVVRGKMHSTGFLFSPSGIDGVLDVVFICNADVRGAMPEFIGKMFWNNKVSALARLREQLEKSLVQKLTFVPASEWEPLKEAHACAVCRRDFGPFRLRRRCKMCGDVICGSCRHSTVLLVPNVGKRQLKLCLRCMVGTANISGDKRLSSSGTATPHSSESWASSPLSDRGSRNNSRPFGPRNPHKLKLTSSLSLNSPATSERSSSRATDRPGSVQSSPRVLLTEPQLLLLERSTARESFRKIRSSHSAGSAPEPLSLSYPSSANIGIANNEPRHSSDGWRYASSDTSSEMDNTPSTLVDENIEHVMRELAKMKAHMEASPFSHSSRVSHFSEDASLQRNTTSNSMDLLSPPANRRTENYYANYVASDKNSQGARVIGDVPLTDFDSGSLLTTPPRAGHADRRSNQFVQSNMSSHDKANRIRKRSSSLDVQRDREAPLRPQASLYEETATKNRQERVHDGSHRAWFKSQRPAKVQIDVPRQRVNKGGQSAPTKKPETTDDEREESYNSSSQYDSEYDIETPTSGTYLLNAILARKRQRDAQSNGQMKKPKETVLYARQENESKAGEASQERKNSISLFGDVRETTSNKIGNVQRSSHSDEEDEAYFHAMKDAQTLFGDEKSISSASLSSSSSLKRSLSSDSSSVRTSEFASARDSPSPALSQRAQSFEKQKVSIDPSGVTNQYSGDLKDMMRTPPKSVSPSSKVGDMSKAGDEPLSPQSLDRQLNGPGKPDFLPLDDGVNRSFVSPLSPVTEIDPADDIPSSPIPQRDVFLSKTPLREHHAEQINKPLEMERIDRSRHSVSPVRKEEGKSVTPPASNTPPKADEGNGTGFWQKLKRKAGFRSRSHSGSSNEDPVEREAISTQSKRGTNDKLKSPASPSHCSSTGFFLPLDTEVPKKSADKEWSSVTESSSAPSSPTRTETLSSETRLPIIPQGMPVREERLIAPSA